MDVRAQSEVLPIRAQRCSFPTCTVEGKLSPRYTPHVLTGSTARKDKPPLRLCTRCKDEFWYCSKTCCVSSILHENCQISDRTAGEGLGAASGTVCTYYRAFTARWGQRNDSKVLNRRRED